MNDRDNLRDCVVLGGGMTGLAAGISSGAPVFEAESSPGGICSSYYVRPNTNQRLKDPPQDGESYRFEIGGGHWIFGGDGIVSRFIRSRVSTKTYKRRSSVFFPDKNLYVPYPLQNHLSYLPERIRINALVEMLTGPKGNSETLSQYLTQNFGETLGDLFFRPFHELYTAGLWASIAPQDSYKSPVNPALAIHGSTATTPSVGYNASFIYPELGLGALAMGMAKECDIHYEKRVVKVDTSAREVVFDDGSTVAYGSLISTLPLNKMLAIAEVTIDQAADPYTSVLVVNLGAIRGQRCPLDHWIYLPKTQAGFHRVGFYDNVDESFLPRPFRGSGDRVSIYVERAYPGGQRPSETEIRAYLDALVHELQAWEFIKQTEVIDPTWIDVAYTWSWPRSIWREEALKRLEEKEIFMVGRYGRWKFQGIAESIRDGLLMGAASRTHREQVKTQLHALAATR